MAAEQDMKFVIDGDHHRASPNSMTETPLSTGAKRHDNSVTIEEYLYWAKFSRADERYEDANHDYTVGGKVIKRSRHPPATELVPGTSRAASDSEHSLNEKPTGPKSVVPTQVGHVNVTDEEYVQASRAIRTASWGAVFYLITTDILGPYGLPYAFAAMGYGPGVVLFTIFGFMAAYGGFLLWRMFLALDSDRYPLRTYSDIAHRVYGPAFRHVVNILQSTQLIMNVGMIVVGNGQSLMQIINGANQNFCFIVLCFIWAVFGMVMGQIRTLRNIGWLANAAIWMNIAIIIITMATIPSSGVNSEAAIASNGQFYIHQGDPVRTSAGIMPGTTFITQVNGFGQSIFAYGGAMLFVEFMAEMRRPFDFWKGMIFAQLFIYSCYMLFGLFVYSYQGQYTLAIAFQGIGSYTFQTVCNSISLVSGIIAALLYGNIGLKVIYNNVLQDLLGFPGIDTKKGKILWAGLIPIYWAIAFVIASAIPQVANLTAFLAALCILQFSYTFPSLMAFGFFAQRDAIDEKVGEGFNPVTGQTVRHTQGFRRYVRGFMRKPFFNAWNVFLFLAYLTCAVLGLYSSIVGMQIQYSTGVGVSFSCDSPLG